MKQHLGSHRIAERLTLLTNRAKGVLVRLYNIRKACVDTKSKPWFLTDKKYEAALKHINKKYPLLERGAMKDVSELREEIVKCLSTYYLTMVDVVELKVFFILVIFQFLTLDEQENILDLLATIDACTIKFDIVSL
ncbi:hypothetical protein ACOME3_008761 [Neoechinorhynchus agilis]